MEHKNFQKHIREFVEKQNPYHIYIKVKDCAVSGEEFDLIQNSEYGFLQTTPQPNPDKLQDYYKSEDYISHTNSKRNLFEKLYHVIRAYTLHKKLRLINSFSTETKIVLDVGCGTGDFLMTAQKSNWTVYGIEPSVLARNMANKKTNNAVFDVPKLSEFNPESFNVITLWHVLEHLPNLESQLKVLKKLLKPNGVLVIAVPNYKSFDANYYKEFWAAYDVPRHLWHFDKVSISKLFSKISMKVIKIKPMWFDAFYVSMLSEKYRTGKMNIFRAFRIGLYSNIKSLQTNQASSLIYIIKNQKTNFKSN